MKRPNKRSVCLICAVSGIILLAIYELLGLGGILLGDVDDDLRYLCDMAVTRALGGGIFLAMLINLGYNVLGGDKNHPWRALLWCLPAFAVAVNNFPFSQIIKGGAVIDAPAWRIAILALECLCIAFFEEVAFRGVVLLGIIKRNPNKRLWIFLSIVISSVIFGLVHLINLYNSSPIAVLMQIGYSALIGAMCSVVIIKTANLWLCVGLHAVFNFGGAVVRYCGSGEIWDAFTVVFTAILAVLVTVYMVISFLRADLSVISGIYRVKVAKIDKE